MLNIPKIKLMDTYEVIICELLEINERETALHVLAHLQKSSDLAEVFKERYLRLDYIIRKPGDIDKLQLYQDTFTTKEQRRNQLATSLISEISATAPPCRLLTLLGNGIRFQYGEKDLT